MSRVVRVAKTIVASFATILARGGSVARSIAGRVRSASFEEDFRSLAPEERAVFAAFLDRDSMTAAFVVTVDGVGLGMAAQGLTARGYLYEVGRRPSPSSTEVCYAIEEPVFAFLKRHPEFLQRARSTERSG